MWKAIMKVLVAIGKAREERDLSKSTYVPQYRGQWVDKGKGNQEDWQWVDKVKTLRPYWVNILQLEDDYVISVGTKPLLTAIESIECEDARMVELQVKYAEKYYKVLGNVVISTQVG